MLDALLYAVRDGITANLGYDQATCRLGIDGRPEPRCGNFFVSVHGGKVRPGPANKRNIYELYDFSVTLTMRVTVPLDQAAESQMALNIESIPLGVRNGFNRRVDQLKDYLHMNWAMTVLQGQTPPSANDNLSAWNTGTIYGFHLPAASAGPEAVAVVDAAWFDEDPEEESFGIKAELRFEGAERLQPQTAAVGVFV